MKINIMDEVNKIAQEQKEKVQEISFDPNFGVLYDIAGDTLYHMGMEYGDPVPVYEDRSSVQEPAFEDLALFTDLGI